MNTAVSTVFVIKPPEHFYLDIFMKRWWNYGFMPTCDIVLWQFAFILLSFFAHEINSEIFLDECITFVLFIGMMFTTSTHP